MRTAKTDQSGRMHRLSCVFAGRKPFCWFCHAAAHVYLAAESLASKASLITNPGVAGSTPARPYVVC